MDDTYLRLSRDAPLPGILEVARPFLPATGAALDLGCGAGQTTLWLLERGYRVTAVDSSAAAIALVASRAPADAPLTLVNAAFADLALDRYAVVCAMYSLFYLSPAEHAAFWPRLVASIEVGGLFIGHFMGERDSWREGHASFTAAALEAELAGLDVLGCHEEERDAPTALEVAKHWHLFHVIAQRC